ncbi:unnamed protein product [Amoebophrya sp. A25]|nr:unnamed protein product [Amoebophrya sp. A25]|eukprot:GSA25T00013027001.1
METSRTMETSKTRMARQRPQRRTRAFASFLFVTSSVSAFILRKRAAPESQLLPSRMLTFRILDPKEDLHPDPPLEMNLLEQHQLSRRGDTTTQRIATALSKIFASAIEDQPGVGVKVYVDKTAISPGSPENGASYAVQLELSGDALQGTQKRFQTPQFARSVMQGLQAAGIKSIAGDLSMSPVKLQEKEVAPRRVDSIPLRTCADDFFALGKTCPKTSLPFANDTACNLLPSMANGTNGTGGGLANGTAMIQTGNATLALSKTKHCAPTDCCSTPETLTDLWCIAPKVLKMWGNYTLSNLADVFKSTNGTLATALCGKEKKVENMLLEGVQNLLSDTDVRKRYVLDVGIGPASCDFGFVGLPVFIGGFGKLKDFREVRDKVTPKRLFEQVVDAQKQLEFPLNLVVADTAQAYGMASETVEYPSKSSMVDWFKPLKHRCSAVNMLSENLQVLPTNLWSYGVDGSIVGTWVIASCYQFTDITCGSEDLMAGKVSQVFHEMLGPTLQYPVKIEAGAGGTLNIFAAAEVHTGGCAGPNAGTTQRYIDVRLTQFAPADTTTILEALDSETFKQELSDRIFSAYSRKEGCKQSDFFWAYDAGGEPHTQEWTSPV